MSETNSTTTSDLSYLDASRVETPVGVLADVELRTATDEPFGTILGVVIDAPARRVRYLDVQVSRGNGGRRTLIDPAEVVVVDARGQTLRLREDVPPTPLPVLEPQTVRPFDDEDLLAAMFPPRAA